MHTIEKELVMATLQRITPCLWFDNQALEAAEFYTSIFPNSAIGRVLHYGEVGQETHGRPAGSVMTVTFELDGQQIIALNGGPHFTFSEAISLIVNCSNQQEIDYYWDKLTDGGEEGVCGWLKDRYGLSWQVAPTILDQMLEDADQDKVDRVMAAFLQMTKIDLAALEQAYEVR
jgi:predicted 3-demethylubiquinone-9 3-methyltransferase (glyoxalase superfamily)